MDLSKFGVEVKDDKPKSIEDTNLEVDFDKIRVDYFSKDEERYLPWFLKYQLKNFDDMIVTSEIKKIIDFIEKFKPGRGLLLYGPAGSGKTTTLNLVGEKYDYEVFEVNASDSRNKNSIDSSIGDVIKQKSLFGKEKLLLIDEVDGVSGSNDRGGVAEIVKHLKASRYPMVFTANDIDSDKIKALKKQCLVVDFVNNSKELLVGIGERILISENVSYDKKELEEFVDLRETSDIRGFINDIQANVINKKFILNDDLEIRDYKKKIEGLMDKIYFSYPEDSVRSTFNSDVNLDDLFLYLEENTPNVYAKGALIQAFNEIAKADVFRGRIMKWQYWRFLVYVNFYLTFGVSTCKGSPKKSIYKKNQRILKKWIYGNQVNALRGRTKIEKKNDVPLRFIEKLSKLYSCSVVRCRKRDLFYFAMQYQNDKEFAKAMDEKLEIDDATRKALRSL
ncbi:MAG: AAA family ATPase [Candidatus Woesearchaeota archaeon]|jgi:replication factor C large subunit|nr:AAA family ATPase [Candidatus Woesearchaeota archaeon]